MTEMATEEPKRAKMQKLRMICEQEVRNFREKAELRANSIREWIKSMKPLTEKMLASRGELAKSTDHLKELEASLRETLKVNAARKAKHTAISEAISTMEVRIEHLQRTLDDQREKKEKYEALLSQQLLALQRIEEKNENVLETKKTRDMTEWYKRVLGLKIEGGEGVKFSFNKIDPNDQDKEYYFFIRLEGDVYILLHCNPQLDNIDELVEELNRSNGLFKFVRDMREKFKETTCKDWHASAVLSPSLNSFESRAEIVIQDEPLPRYKTRNLGSVHEDVPTKVAILSPLRRSPRFMVKKLS